MLIETLTQEEARVLGTLLEKSLATPDYYPMTLNALRTACNQKSSRDPVTEYGEDTVGLALSGLKRKCLVTFIPYGSQGNNHKYRHFLEDVRFGLEKAELAALAVLLLRGAQTVNEIKTRAAGLHPIDSLEAAEAVLHGLARRAEPLAELLPKRPGWKEPRWRDTVREHGEEAEEQPENPRGIPSAAKVSDLGSGPAASQDEIAELRREIMELRAGYEELKSQVGKIRSELGG
jgi:uncharacterized protein YceH (UPF0502 family)